jgi:hypothetical protein
MMKFDDDPQSVQGGNDVYPRTSLVYRRCEYVFLRLLALDISEISDQDLVQLIKKYIGGSPQTVKSYRHNFVDFEFLKPHLQKPSFIVNYEKNIFSVENKRIKKAQEDHAFSQFSGSPRVLRPPLNAAHEHYYEQSKTVIYPEDGKEKKRTCSFKGYPSIWKAFTNAVKEDGFPSVCYVEHIFHSAYLKARQKAEDTIHIPFRIGEMNIFITIVAPYVVERPRRYRKHIKKETIDIKTEF